MRFTRRSSNGTIRPSAVGRWRWVTRRSGGLLLRPATKPANSVWGTKSSEALDELDLHDAGATTTVLPLSSHSLIGR